MTNSLGPNVDWDTALLIGRCISGLCWPASNGLIMHYSSIGGPAACSAYCRYWKHLSGPFIKVKSPRPIRSLACQWTSWFCFWLPILRERAVTGSCVSPSPSSEQRGRPEDARDRSARFHDNRTDDRANLFLELGCFFWGRLWIFVFHDDLFLGAGPRSCFC